jgi:hypothetical protein
MPEVAAASGVPAETLRKIETGRIATPAFFTVAALAAALGLSLEDVARQCALPVEIRPAEIRPGKIRPAAVRPGEIPSGAVRPAARRARAG